VFISPGDHRGVVKADVSGGTAGQRGHRIVAACLAQRAQQVVSSLRVLEADAPARAASAVTASLAPRRHRG
jgi:hypothetical protein